MLEWSQMLRFRDTINCDIQDFIWDVLFNFHNEKFWVVENPQQIRGQCTQNISFRWAREAGIIGDYMIGPYLPGRLNCESYVQCLRDVLPRQLEDIPLKMRANMCTASMASPTTGYASIRFSFIGSSNISCSHQYTRRQLNCLKFVQCSSLYIVKKRLYAISTIWR